MATSTVNPAASSPAVAVPTDPHAYAEWRMTGKVPEAAESKPKTEESAPSKDSSDAGDEPAEGARASEKAPESEPGKKQEHKPKGAEARLNELLADLKRAGLSPAELKSFKREAQRQEPQAEPHKAAPEHTEKPVKAEPPKKPKMEDFEGKSWEDYEAARDKYFEDLADYRAQQRLDEFQQSQRQESAQRELQGKLADAEKRYGADAKTTIGNAAAAIFNDAKVSAAVKELINGSPVLVDLLYTAGSNAEEFEAFIADARSNPGAAIRKAVLLEHLVTEELAKGDKSEAGTKETPARGEDGKFAKAPEKKVTEAPPPPREVSGRGAAPSDEVESAVKAGDFTRFRSAANRRDIARQQGR
jgi:hypothetical protein